MKNYVGSICLALFASISIMSANETVFKGGIVKNGDLELIITNRGCISSIAYKGDVLMCQSATGFAVSGSKAEMWKPFAPQGWKSRNVKMQLNRTGKLVTIKTSCILPFSSGISTNLNVTTIIANDQITQNVRAESTQQNPWRRLTDSYKLNAADFKDGKYRVINGKWNDIPQKRRARKLLNASDIEISGEKYTVSFSFQGGKCFLFDDRKPNRSILNVEFNIPPAIIEKDKRYGVSYSSTIKFSKTPEGLIKKTIDWTKTAGNKNIKIKASGQSKINIDTSQAYFVLPRHVWGMKFSGYYTEMVNNTKYKTADGKTYSDLIMDLKMDWLKAAMQPIGTPENPTRIFKDWKKLADKIVDAGGVYFPELHIAPAGLPGSKERPQVINNINKGNEFSIKAVLRWLAFLAKEKGVDKLRGYEPYNEPACMSSIQRRKDYWYSKKDFNDPARLCADWASVHHRQIAIPVMKKYPNVTVCGSAFSAPASPYGIKELNWFINGCSDWPWKDNNTAYMTALSIHSYGFRDKGRIPSAPDAGQSAINSYFYSTYKNPGNISGYWAAVDKIRKLLNDAGGKKVKITNSEWWALGTKKLTPGAGSRSALGDIIGVIVHCINAEKWKFDSISFHAANPVAIDKDLSRWKGPEDGMVCVVDGKLLRPPRYYANRDINGPFMNNYKKLVKTEVSTSMSSPGTQKNPAKKVYACAGIKTLKDGSQKLGILVINIDTNIADNISLSWDKPASGEIKVTRLPGELKLDTPLPIEKKLLPLGSRRKLSLILGPAEAALIEIPYLPAKTIGKFQFNKAQEGSRYYHSFKKWAKEDEERIPGGNAVLCVGSSSMKMWKNIKKDLTPLNIIHRGFGGSTMAQVLKWKNFFLRYKANTVLIYEGDNDLNSNRLPLQTFIAQYKDFCNALLEVNPKAKIYIISIKPSLARLNKWPRMAEANELLKKFATTNPQIFYIDVATPVMQKNGRPRADIFLGDNLHLNPKGYAVWTKIIRAKLIK
jgi:lysophospholipase L1-like esterase